jgi:dihydropteroate synthase
VLVGTSRKGMLGTLAARAAAAGAGDGAPPPAPPSDRLEGSLATAVWAQLAGAAMVRVHDVAATVRARDAVAREVVAAPAAG